MLKKPCKSVEVLSLPPEQIFRLAAAEVKVKQKVSNLSAFSNIMLGVPSCEGDDKVAPLGTRHRRLVEIEAGIVD